MDLVVDLRSGGVSGQQDRGVVVSLGLGLVVDAADQKISPRFLCELLHLGEGDLVEEQGAGSSSLGPDEQVRISLQGLAAHAKIPRKDGIPLVLVPVIVDRDVALHSRHEQRERGNARCGEDPHPVAEDEDDQKDHRKKVEVRPRPAGADLEAQALDRDRCDRRGEDAKEGEAGGSRDGGNLGEGDVSSKSDAEGVPPEPAEEGPAQPLKRRPCGGGKQGDQEVPERSEPRPCRILPHANGTQDHPREEAPEPVVDGEDRA